MPAAITTLRGTLATDLANAGVWSTFAFPAPTLLANSVSVIPADPYITPTNNDNATIAPLVSFSILIAVLLDINLFFEHLPLLSVLLYFKILALLLLSVQSSCSMGPFYPVIGFYCSLQLFS